MSNVFDPYYTWLGIPPEEQPADHYRLLGLRQFEANPDVISNASDQRMGHIRTFQAGKRAADSQRILNELAAATRCLLNQEQKKAYDEQLTAKQAKMRPQAVARPAPVAVAKPVVAKPVAAITVAVPAPVVAIAAPVENPAFVAESAAERIESKRRKSQQRTLFFVVGGVAFLGLGVIAAGAMIYLNRSRLFPIPEVANMQPLAPKTPSSPIEEAKDNKSPPPTTPVSEQPKPGENPPSPTTQTTPVTNPPPKTPGTNPDSRRLWVYLSNPEGKSGSLRLISPGQWEERRSDGEVWKFEERERNENEITLFDINRRIWVILNNEQMRYRYDVSPRWVLAQQGSWSTDELAKLPPTPPAPSAQGEKITWLFRGDGKFTWETTDAAFLDSQEKFTLEFWFCHRGALRDTPGLLHCGDLQIYITTGTDEPEQGRCLALAAGSEYIRSAEFSLDHKWHHLALMRNGEQIALFLDGRQQLNVLLNKLTLNKLTPVVLGEAVNAESVKHKFTGEVRSLRFTNLARYADETRFTPYISIAGTQLPAEIKMVAAGNASSVANHFDNALVNLTVNAPPVMPIENPPPKPTIETVKAKPKAAPPEKEKLDLAKATVATVFNSKIKTAIKPEQKLDLGYEILKAVESEEDTAVVYALLGEARTQALGSLHVALLLDVVDEVDRRFTVDRLNILAKLLPEMNNNKLLIDQREALVSLALQATSQAIAEEKINIANDLSDLAANAVKVSKSIELKKAVKYSRDQVIALKTSQEEVQKSLKVLEQTPDDPAANSVVGKYYVFGLENFEKGLPYLAKDGKSPLGEIAQQELAAKTQEEYCAVAEAWYEHAASLKGNDKLVAQRHVAGKYEAMLDQITGVLQLKAKERIAELKPVLEESTKTKSALAKLTLSKKPIPGLVGRLVAGSGTRAVLTPYVFLAQSKDDLQRIPYYDYIRNYPSSSPHYQLLGLVVVEKDTEVMFQFSNCKCRLDDKAIDADNLITQRVPMKKGTYKLIVNSTFGTPNFQVTRTDSGESLLFHTEEILQTQLELPAALATGLPSKGIRIDNQ
jgi:hypothetical protein